MAEAGDLYFRTTHYTCRNEKTWLKVNLSKKLNTLFGKPAQVINDADMLALGVVSGKGLEMLITH